MPPASPRQLKRRWRHYKTPAGADPVGDFLDALTEPEALDVAAAMKEVERDGLVAARHLRGDIYEVRAICGARSFRILFATEGQRSQVLLAVHAIQKQSQATPAREIDLAEHRLARWRGRHST